MGVSLLDRFVCSRCGGEPDECGAGCDEYGFVMASEFRPHLRVHLPTLLEWARRCDEFFDSLPRAGGERP